MIQHVPLALRARYVFCCAPINRKMPFVCSMFLKFARQYSKNEAVSFDFVVSNCGWPFQLPKTILDLVQLEAVFDVMDLYLWLRFVCLVYKCKLFSVNKLQLQLPFRRIISECFSHPRNTKRPWRSNPAGSISNNQIVEKHGKYGIEHSRCWSTFNQSKVVLITQRYFTSNLRTALKKRMENLIFYLCLWFARDIHEQRYKSSFSWLLCLCRAYYSLTCFLFVQNRGHLITEEEVVWQNDFCHKDY